MSRIGSRSNPLITALLAGRDAGAFTLPPSMAESRDRLAAVRAAVAELQHPNAEQAARIDAVRALVADPASDVAGAVAEARQLDAAHELHSALLREAADAAADEVDRIDLEAFWTEHLRPAYAAVLNRLAAAYRVFSPVSTNPDDLWGAPTKIRNAWTEFRRAAADYEAIRAVWLASRAGQPAAALDTEGLFAEIVNLDAVWPERVEGLRPISTMRAPWPPRVDSVEWLLWAHSAGAELHLPSVEQQDAAWSRVFGARAAEFALGDRHVGQMRELFG